MSFSEKLKLILTEKGISQYRLSKLSGISQSTLSDIITGKKSPNGITLRKICDALGLSLAEFDENKKEAAELLPRIKENIEKRNLRETNEFVYGLIDNMSPEELEKEIAELIPIAEKIKGLSAKNKEAIMTIIDSLASRET
ncbi:helix-turn-helix domain-containing protein [Sporomusa aerivorans]|uniref:helix-turn-helix domain-containing protein n=1 Tax=Sporomusa aerivorans TaxID=204936 RepID=UPI00352B1242